MTTVERTRYISAYNTIYTQPAFVALVTKHELLFNMGIHQSPVFFPWHRWFLYEIEQLLQAVDCRVYMPYWAWTREAANPFASLMWTASPSWFGTGAGGCVNDGGFAGLMITSGGCLSRSFNPLATFASTADVAGYYSTYPLPSDYDSFRNTIENGPGLHGAVHCAISGTMCTLGAANSPEFVLHHAQIDKIWLGWQELSAAHVTAFLGNPNAAMPGTTHTPAEFFDIHNQLGVDVCYIEPGSKFEFVDDLLASLSAEELKAVPRTPVTTTPDEWFRQMNMLYMLSEVRMMEAERNDPTMYNLVTRDQLSEGDDVMSGTMGFKMDWYRLAQTTDLELDGIPAPSSYDQDPGV